MNSAPCFLWLQNETDGRTTPRPDEPQCRSTGDHCITASATSCHRMPDGDYQACESCTVYHSCSGGVIWSYRPCPDTDYGGLRGKLVWQRISNNVGTCERSSTTCRECDDGVSTRSLSSTNDCSVKPETGFRASQQ